MHDQLDSLSQVVTPPLMPKVGRELLAPDQPYALAVEITSRCNLTCRMCPLTTGRTLSSRQPGPMRDVLWEEVVEIAREVGQVIVGGFGDPLTSPRCLPFLEALDSHGVATSLSTNGIALTPRIAGRLAKLRNLSHVNVSIDAPDAAIYRDIRGGELDRALAGASNLVAVMDDPRKVTVSSVLMRGNLASLVAFPALLASLGIRRYVVQGFFDFNPELALENPVEDPAGASADLARLREACGAAGVELLVNSGDRVALDVGDPATARDTYYRLEGAPGTTKQCMVPWEAPLIDKDGRVMPCCFAAANGGPVLGRLGEQDWHSIWRGARYQAFRRRLLTGRTPEVCRRCSAAPWGEHPFRSFAAEIAHKRSQLRATETARVVFLNTGSRAWTPTDNVRIGTSNPRDWPSAFAHPSWLDDNRVTSFIEPRVEPGHYATFEFALAPGVKQSSETFQLVVEGVSWLPGTRFTIERIPQIRARVLHRLRSVRDGVVARFRTQTPPSL